MTLSTICFGGKTYIDLPGGNFTAGTANSSSRNALVNPIRSESVSPFAIAETPVTNLEMNSYIQWAGDRTYGLLEFDPKTRKLGLLARSTPNQDFDTSDSIDTSKKDKSNLKKAIDLCKAESKARLSVEESKYGTRLAPPIRFGKKELYFLPLVPAANRYSPPGRSSFDFAANPNLPAVFVNWFEAQGYLAWFNTSSGIAQQGLSARLPRELEREFAAKGGSANDDYPTQDGQLKLTEDKKEIDSQEANRFGIRGLSGNLFEWSEEGACPENVGTRILRGGYMSNGHMLYGDAQQGRSAYQVMESSIRRTIFIGFRILLSRHVEP